MPAAAMVQIYLSRLEDRTSEVVGPPARHAPLRLPKLAIRCEWLCAVQQNLRGGIVKLLAGFEVQGGRELRALVQWPWS